MNREGVDAAAQAAGPAGAAATSRRPTDGPPAELRLHRDALVGRLRIVRRRHLVELVARVDREVAGGVGMAAGVAHIVASRLMPRDRGRRDSGLPAGGTVFADGGVDRLDRRMRARASAMLSWPWPDVRRCSMRSWCSARWPLIPRWPCCRHSGDSRFRLFLGKHPGEPLGVVFTVASSPAHPHPPPAGRCPWSPRRSSAPALRGVACARCLRRQRRLSPCRIPSSCGPGSQSGTPAARCCTRSSAWSTTTRRPPGLPDDGEHRAVVPPAMLCGVPLAARAPSIGTLCCWRAGLAAGGAGGARRWAMVVVVAPIAYAVRPPKLAPTSAVTRAAMPLMMGAGARRRVAYRWLSLDETRPGVLAPGD